MAEKEDTYDETDGGSLTTGNERKFYLPLIGPFDTNDTNIPRLAEKKHIDNKDNGTRKLQDKYGEVVFNKRYFYDTMSSKRASRTIDFVSNVWPSSSDISETIHKPVLSSGTNYCSPSQFLSLSPVLSFPFRQNELASPDTPIQNPPSNAVSPSKLHPHASEVPSTNSKSKKISDIPCNNSIINHSPNRICNDMFERRNVQNSPEQPGHLQEERDYLPELSQTKHNTAQRPVHPKTTTFVSSFVLSPVTTVQHDMGSKPSESCNNKTSFPSIWRPIPQMATPVSPVKDQPYSAAVNTPYTLVAAQTPLPNTMSNGLAEHRGQVPVSQPSLLRVSLRL